MQEGLQKTCQLSLYVMSVCIYLIHYLLLLLFSSTVLGCLLIIIEFLALCSFVCKCCMECEFKYTVMALYGEMSSCLPRHISFTGKKKTTGNCSMRLGIQPQGCSTSGLLLLATGPASTGNATLHYCVCHELLVVGSSLLTMILKSAAHDM